ncbi:MAG: T9SS type A sorting domain-containing protein [Paludibacter sp.]|nr:T9SS type A sorting domain-containing protein [Paludibacter sp.]
MKSNLLLLSVILMSFSLGAQTLEQRFFIDFGPNDVTNGNVMANPDANGKYWTSFTGSALNDNITLTNTTNVTSTYVLTTTTACQKNGILNGGLLTSDPALLGEMAINTATQDYFYNNVPASFKISGLNPAKGYKFYTFGSRNTAEVRTTQYIFTGTNTFTGTNQTSGPGLGGGAVNQNTQTFLNSTIITPNSAGEITIAVSVVAGTYWHLNMMKLEEYSNLSTGLKQTNSSSDIEVYNKINQQIVVKGAKQTIELYNQAGMRIISQTAADETYLNTSNISKGMYILVVDKIKSFKLIN